MWFERRHMICEQLARFLVADDREGGIPLPEKAVRYCATPTVASSCDYPFVNGVTPLSHLESHSQLLQRHMHRKGVANPENSTCWAESQPLCTVLVSPPASTKSCEIRRRSGATSGLCSSQCAQASVLLRIRLGAFLFRLLDFAMSLPRSKTGHRF